MESIKDTYIEMNLYSVINLRILNFCIIFFLDAMKKTILVNTH